MDFWSSLRVYIDADFCAYVGSHVLSDLRRHVRRKKAGWGKSKSITLVTASKERKIDHLEQNGKCASRDKMSDSDFFSLVKV